MIQERFNKFNLVEAVKRHAFSAIIGSILAIAVAVLLFIVPGYASATIIWIILGLLALAGLGAVVRFIFPGEGASRDAMSFILGLVVIALFIVLLLCALNFPPYVEGDTNLTGFEHFSLQIIRFLSIFFGVLSIILSILGLFSVIHAEKKVLYILWTILNLTLGVLMVMFPFILWFVGVYLAAAYLVIISIIAIVIASKAIHQANKTQE